MIFRKQDSSCHYLRYLQHGVLEGLCASQFHHSNHEAIVVKDCIATAYDIRGFSFNQTRTRHSDTAQLFQLFDHLQPTFAAHEVSAVMVVCQGIEIDYRIHGPDDTSLISAVQKCAKNPICYEDNLLFLQRHMQQPGFGATPLSLSEQLALLNSLPAKNIHITHKTTRTNVCVARHNTSCKTLIMTSYAHPKKITESAAHSIATVSRTSSSKKRPLSEESLSKQLASFASKQARLCKATTPSSSLRINVDLSVLERFKSSLSSSGLVRVYGDFKVQLNIVWNKFDSATRTFKIHVAYSRL